MKFKNVHKRRSPITGKKKQYKSSKLERAIAAETRRLKPIVPLADAMVKAMQLDLLTRGAAMNTTALDGGACMPMLGAQNYFCLPPSENQRLKSGSPLALFFYRLKKLWQELWAAAGFKSPHEWILAGKREVEL